MKAVLRKNTWLVVTVCFFVFATARCSQSETAQKSPNPASPKPVTQSQPEETQVVAKKAQTGEMAEIETSFGKIKLKFYPDVAPNHVKNFKNLAQSGFYDGTTFHRVIPGFMIQGGDPNTKDANRANDGQGGSGKNIKAEFNSKSHVRGTLSMARSRSPDSASSQFFICVAEAPHLNGQYTAFGEVVEGMDVVDKIVAVKRDARDNPLEKVEMKVRWIESPKKS